MKIRFLKKTNSPKAGQLPYTPGQEIEADKNDRDVVRWLKDKQAEVVPEPEVPTTLPTEPPPTPDNTLPGEGEGAVPPTDETTPPAQPKEKP